MQGIRIYNTLTKQKERFEPIKPGHIDLYVCGMTVYDYCHIGHGRMFVVFDAIVRYLRAIGFKVAFVRNITDIDDKIINRANENNEACSELTERFINIMREDTDALGVLPADHEPRATQHIPQIIALIEKLIEKGFAYVAENGDVYYDVAKFKDYGELAHQNLEQLQSGIRVDVLDEKHNPLDFVLWKLAKPGEPKWDSPWGEGRPGWHIECSAMSTELLGQPFDIHGGGVDLVFPHHQNEVAQSEGAQGCQFVKTWIHSGHVRVNEEKMSKSLGNFFTIRDVLKQYDAETTRYFLLASHYRSPINYSNENLDSAYQALLRFYTSLRDLPDAKEKDTDNFEQRFNDAMNDDFNTPVAFSVLFDIAREINRLKDENKIDDAAKLGVLLKRLGGVLGFLQQDPEQFLKGNIDQDFAEKVEALIAKRNAARKEKNWAEADKVRDELTKMGVSLEDTAEGTLWRHGSGS